MQNVMWHDRTTARGVELYKYKPLQRGQIRVFRMSRGRPDEPLSGTLETGMLQDHCGSQVEHEETTGYVALSYAWGCDELSDLVLCDGQAVRVTASLHGALLQVRNHLPARSYAYALRKAADSTILPSGVWQKGMSAIWADGLCIDQGSILERNEQVQIMGRIFERSNKLLISLGHFRHGDIDQRDRLVNMIRSRGFLQDLPARAATIDWLTGRVWFSRRSVVGWFKSFGRLLRSDAHTCVAILLFLISTLPDGPRTPLQLPTDL